MDEFTTTFWSDFTIADAFGIDAVKDTFKRAFKEWKDDYKYLTDLVIVLNHKCWEHYERGNQQLSKLYQDYFYEAQNYAYDTLKGEEFDYFWKKVD
jgi:hypothetical protein